MLPFYVIIIYLFMHIIIHGLCFTLILNSFSHGFPYFLPVRNNPFLKVLILRITLQSSYRSTYILKPCGHEVQRLIQLVEYKLNITCMVDVFLALAARIES